MNDLKALIEKDWYVLEKSAGDPDKLISTFKLQEEELDIIIQDLINCVMEGIFEYKRNQITALLRPLQSLQYDSKAIAMLPQQIKKGKELLLVALLQRLYCLKKIKLSTDKTSKSSAQSLENVTAAGIGDILTFVQQEIKKDPEKMKDPEIKKIIMYSKMYQQEIHKLKDLLTAVPEGKKESVKRNFRNSLNEIAVKLNTSYNALTDAERNKEKNAGSGSILTRNDYSPAVPVITSQCRIYSEILTTLKFAEKEKFNTRELLVSLSSRQDELFNQIEREQKVFSEITPFDKNGTAAGKELAGEIMIFLKKERDWVKLHPWR